MRTRFPTPIASAPPLPPSPVTTATTGTRSADISRRLRAMASAWPRSSGDAGVGARRVDEGDDRLAELVGELHQAQRLPVAFGMRHPEVPCDLLARLPPLLVPDDHHALVLEAGEAGHDRRIVAEEPIAVELEEVP